MSARSGMFAALGALFALLLSGGPCAAGEAVRLGLARLATNGPIYIALDKGYFAAEGLDVTLVDIEAAQPIAVGVVAGDLDFGVAGLSAAFYTLASQGTLRIIAGGVRDAPGFQNVAIVASNRAYREGLTSFAKLGGRSVAVAQAGSPTHYALGLIAAAYGIDLKTIRLVLMQSIPSVVAAVSGGQADAGSTPATAALPAIQRGDMRLLGYVGDVVPWQLGAVWTSTRTADERRGTVERFLSAYKKGVASFHDAFTGPDGRRRDGPTAPAILAIVAKHVGQPEAQIARGIPYYDAAARIDVADIKRQIAWYDAQGMIKGKVEADAVIDRRYAAPLPER